MIVDNVFYDDFYKKDKNTTRIRNILNKFWRVKWRDLTQSSDKSPYIHRKIQKAKLQYKNATKHFDYTMIADRLRTVSWGNDSHPTGVFTG